MIIRPFTILTGMAFVLSGAMMFVVKHQSQAMDAQLSATNEATTQDEQSIRVLQAQWALEADPSRLAQLATQFTGLQPMKPGQLVTMASLGTSLPAPGAKPPGDNPEDPVPALPQLAAAVPAAPAAAQAAPAPVQTAAVVPPAIVPGAVAPAVAPAPAQLAAQESAPAPAAKPVAAPVHFASLAPVVPHHHAAAERVATIPMHHVTRHDSGSSVYLADASGPAPARGMPMGAQLVPVRAVASPAPSEDGGSLLGMAQGGSQ